MGIPVPGIEGFRVWSEVLWRRSDSKPFPLMVLVIATAGYTSILIRSKVFRYRCALRPGSLPSFLRLTGGMGVSVAFEPL